MGHDQDGANDTEDGPADFDCRRRVFALADSGERGVVPASIARDLVAWRERRLGRRRLQHRLHIGGLEGQSASDLPRGIVERPAQDERQLRAGVAMLRNDIARRDLEQA